jgi:hypothetical protein
MVVEAPQYPTPSGDPAEFYMRRFERARAIRENWVSLFEDCYTYTLPARESFYMESGGSDRTDHIFDETAVVGVQEFASRLQSGLVPTFARWADLKAGQQVPEKEREDIDRKLSEVTEYIFEILQNSNFNQEVHESFMDLAVGTGCLLVEEGDVNHPIRFNAVPLPHIYLEAGPDDQIEGVYRTRRMRHEDIQRMWPGAEMPASMQARIMANNNQMCNLIECTVRNTERPNEVAYDYLVISKDDKSIIYRDEFKGTGSSPWVVFRWSKASGEIYGRGPVLNALPSIKTCNLTVELILENAQLAISGIWQVDDDGTVNADTINLVPGTVVPRAPGSAGLTPITPPGRFDVSQLILDDMRLNIRRALYNEMLGDPNKTPMTATEVAERMADLSRQIGSAFGRLQAELVQPLLQRVIFLLKKRGLIEIPQINGREMRISATSPLARSQKLQDVTTVDRFVELIGARFGPQALSLAVKPEAAAQYMAERLGVPPEIMRTEVERQQIVQYMQQAANAAQQQQMQQAPVDAAN